MAALAAATLAIGCGDTVNSGPAPVPTTTSSAVPDAGCKTQSDCSPKEDCSGGTCTPFAVCPDGLEATFASLNTKVFAVNCGTNTSGCHSTAGSVDSGGLDLVSDPYTNLLGSDGKGAFAENISGSEHPIRRVVPGDPDHSFLYIKLNTKIGTDPQYGSGMPFPTPGSVCPGTLKAVHDWIQAGAAQ